MESFLSRNKWIVCGLILLFVFDITLLNISGINIVLAILCFNKAYKIHKMYIASTATK